jgi:hypothetical protein
VCLTDKALKDRFWGSLDNIRILLEGRKIPDSYYGHSSASDNPFDAVSRNLKLLVLVSENKKSITDAVASCQDDKQIHLLIDELQMLQSMLQDKKRWFEQGIRDVEDIIDNVRHMASR